MEYNVSDATLAIIPNGKSKSKVIEKDADYVLNVPTFKVIESSCEYFGVSYESRLKGSYKFIKSKYKPPILIEESSRLIFFPVSSPTKHNALWVNYSNISDYYPYKNKRHTIIKFRNGYKLEIDTSFYSFNQQYMKATRLNCIISDRILRK